MAKKNLTVTQIKMYEAMIQSDFKELMARLKEYRTALKEQARVEVAKETGLYELKKMEKTLELQLEEIRNKIKTIEGTSRWNRNDEFEERVERKINELLGQIGGGSLADIEANYEFFLRKVRLAGVTDDVRDLFETNLPNKIKELTAMIRLLPEPPKANEDEVKLVGSGE